MKLSCQQCSGVMRKKTITSGSMSGCLLGVGMILVGVCMFILIPVIGWVLGPVVVLVGMAAGGKRRKVWRCRKCGAVIDRV